MGARAIVEFDDSAHRARKVREALAIQIIRAGPHGWPFPEPLR